MNSTPPRIGVVIGSTREGRFGDKPATWIHEIASPSAVLKNAFDYGCKEFARKPIGFVGYGGVGAARAVEQLRLVAVEVQMARVRHAVHIGMAEFPGLWQQGKKFEDYPHLAQAADAMLGDVAWWAKALKTARETA
jgi:NAD(P)H-dependent FMN reductase